MSAPVPAASGQIEFRFLKMLIGTYINVNNNRNSPIPLIGQLRENSRQYQMIAFSDTIVVTREPGRAPLSRLLFSQQESDAIHDR